MRVRALLAVAALAAAVSSVASLDGPGVNVEVTNKGLQYGADTAMTLLAAHLDDLAIPDVQEEADTPIGKLVIALTNMKITKVDAKQVAVSVKDNALHLDVADGAIELSLHWQYKKQGHMAFEDEGDGTIDGGKLSFGLGVAVTATPTGHVLIKCQDDVTAGVGSLKIRTDGKHEWMYRVLEFVFGPVIRRGIASLLIKEVPLLIDDLGAEAVAHLPVSVPVDQYATLSYALNHSPVFGADRVAVDMVGAFYDRTKPVPPPYKPPGPFPPAHETQMVSVSISEYTISSGLGVHFVDGAFNLHAVPENIPPDVGFKLNTDFWQSIVPEIAKAHPHMDMTLNMGLTQEPTVQVHEQKTCSIAMHGNVQFNVRDKAGKETPCFTVVIDLHGDLQAELRDMNITGKIMPLTITTDLVSSDIGPIDLKVLRQFIDYATRISMIPILNKKLAVGVPLPIIKGASLHHAQTLYHDGFVTTLADVEYKPDVLAAGFARRVALRRSQTSAVAEAGESLPTAPIDLPRD